MDDALQLALSLARFQKDTCALNMRPAVQLGGYTGMIEPSDEVIDMGDAIDSLLYLLSVGDLAWNDCDCLAEELTCLFCVACQNTDRLVLAQQFGDKSRTEETGGTCYEDGHCFVPPAPGRGQAVAPTMLRQIAQPKASIVGAT